MRRNYWCLLLAATVMLLGACGVRKSEAGVASVNGSAQPNGEGGDARRFEQCMRENGAPPQDLGGGQNQSGSAVVTPESDPDVRRRNQLALQTCRRFLPGGGHPQPLSAEQLEQAMAVAKCMRAVGVNYPDPDPFAGAGPGAQPIPSGVDLSDATVLAKFRECQRQAGTGELGPGASGIPGVR